MRGSAHLWGQPCPCICPWGPKSRPPEGKSHCSLLLTQRPTLRVVGGLSPESRLGGGAACKDGPRAPWTHSGRHPGLLTGEQDPEARGRMPALSGGRGWRGKPGEADPCKQTTLVISESGPGGEQSESRRLRGAGGRGALLLSVVARGGGCRLMLYSLTVSIFPN